MLEDFSCTSESKFLTAALRWFGMTDFLLDCDFNHLRELWRTLFFA
jgi:hypothetical protein